MALGQSLHQSLLQKLSPQQIQLMKLLQVPTSNLEERIREELEENPALELEEKDPGDGEDAYDDEIKDEFENSKESDEFAKDGSEDEYGDIDVSEYISDDDGEMPEYKTKSDNYPEMDNSSELPIKAESNFFDILASQLSLLDVDENQYKIAEQIIGSLDDDGYLRREIMSIVDDMAFKQNIETNEKEVIQILKQIQQFDPPGVGARNLRECLLIQLERKQDENIYLATVILDKYFEEFTRKHYEKIQRILEITEEQLKAVIQQIIKLNPKPGDNVGNQNLGEKYVIPDFFVLNNGGKLELTLNARNAPDLRISGDYKDMMQVYTQSSKKDKRQKEAVFFIKQKIESAKWFIEMIKQRRETLIHTMSAIMEHQHNFFISGEEITMRPMILKDIAEKTGLDISTVSRVANSKYVQTEYGTFKLKYFFSERLSTESGEDVSTVEVKKILCDLIDAEDKMKPLADDTLTNLLNEKGYNIARRTVAKYREQLNIPVGRLRKELK